MKKEKWVLSTITKDKIFKEIFRGKMIIHLPLIIFSASITTIFEATAAKALFRIAEDDIEIRAKFVYIVLSFYNLALFLFSLSVCKTCFAYKKDVRLRVMDCGVFWMVLFIIASIVSLVVIFNGVFGGIDIRFGYEFRIFFVVFIIGSLKALATK